MLDADAQKQISRLTAKMHPNLMVKTNQKGNIICPFLAIKLRLKVYLRT